MESVRVVLAFNEVGMDDLFDLLLELGDGCVEQALHLVVDHVDVVVPEVILCGFEAVNAHLGLVQLVQFPCERVQPCFEVIKLQLCTHQGIFSVQLLLNVGCPSPSLQVDVHVLVPEMFEHILLHLDLPPLYAPVLLEHHPHIPHEPHAHLFHDFDVQSLVNSGPFGACSVRYFLHLRKFDITDSDEPVALFVEPLNFSFNFCEVFDLLILHV